jgi:hypothetical protein
MLALISCGVQDAGGGLGLDLTFLGHLGLDIGEVFVCDDGADPALELCWGSDDPATLAEALDASRPGAWSCAATQRHSGPCIYGCTPHKGCNAFDGCACFNGAP